MLHIKVLLQDNINNKTQIQEVGTKNCNRIRKMYIRLEIIELENIRHKIYNRLEAKKKIRKSRNAKIKKQKKRNIRNEKYEG